MIMIKSFPRGGREMNSSFPRPGFEPGTSSPCLLGRCSTNRAISIITYTEMLVMLFYFKIFKTILVRNLDYNY